MTTQQNQDTIFEIQGVNYSARTYYQCSPETLVKDTLERKQGILTSTGALAIQTGKFTGRSPRDKYIVNDDYTKAAVYWNDFNNSLSEPHFNLIYRRMLDDIRNKEVWVRDAKACAAKEYQINLRVVTDTPWANLFSYNMFLRSEELPEEPFSEPEWHVYHIASFNAIPGAEGVRAGNFSIINFSKKVILIGGTGYTGEIKKSVFTVLNMVLPLEQKVLTMHCSANAGTNGDTALFFGLSGTGKTTLSTSPNRYLIGDDEHGWADDSIFNFEGGCYAKCAGLKADREPEIFGAIKRGALLENVSFTTHTNIVDFDDTSITENSRVSYPLHFLSNPVSPSVGGVPNNIFFLTCDAYGVLPPVSRLTTQQALYYYLNGYTAKVAGTELGVSAPVPVFSTCFGAPFLPLSPQIYAEMLGEKIEQSNARVWLINTGWSGGPAGVGQRISLANTRAIITAVLTGELNNGTYFNDEVFGLSIPATCPGVETAILNPVLTWNDSKAYYREAAQLLKKFDDNYARLTANNDVKQKSILA